VSAPLTASGLGVTAGAARLLEGVDLRAEPGDFLAIVGPNGAGKSTLLRALLGLARPAAGAVTVGDRPVDALGGRERAGLLSWLPQRDAGVEPVRVVDRVAAARFRFAEGRAASLKAAAQALVALDVAGLSERLVDTLSGGEAQRVALAALAAQEATWWLLDEPAHHLDPARQVAVYRHLGDRWRAGQGMVVVTHDVNLLAHAAPGEQAERLTVVGLAEGQVRFRAPLADPTMAERLSELFGVAVRGVDVDGARHFAVTGGAP
jgi:iron complex transport system ATP-binding protein